MNTTLNKPTSTAPPQSFPTLTPDILARIKPEIIKRADSVVDRAQRMLAGKFTAREFECLWVGVMEWKHFIEALLPGDSDERFLHDADTISGKLDWMMREIRQAVELARANPIRVVVGIDGGKFRGASASHVGVKVEAFDWDVERGTNSVYRMPVGSCDDAREDQAQDKFAQATKGLVVLC